jgi:hypothetical protein
LRYITLRKRGERAMAIFTFEAPALLDRPSALGALRSYARQRRLLCWLRDRLAARGVETFGPVADDSGWRLAVNAESGFVSIRLGGGYGGRCTVVVDQLGEADAEYEDTVAAFEDALGDGGWAEAG